MENNNQQPEGIRKFNPAYESVKWWQYAAYALLVFVTFWVGWIDRIILAIFMPWTNQIGLFKMDYYHHRSAWSYLRVGVFTGIFFICKYFMS